MNEHLLPLQGATTPPHENPGRCPGLYAFALSGRVHCFFFYGAQADNKSEQGKSPPKLMLNRRL